MRVKVLIAGLGILIAACGSSEDKTKTPSGARASCQEDSECVLVTATTCCAICQSEPRAIPKEDHVRQENKCATLDCAKASDRVECPKVASPDGFVAKCKDRTCAAVPKH